MSAVKHTPGPWSQGRYGNIGFEIIGGGHAIAVVGRVQEKRLEYLRDVRSKAAKRGERAHQAEEEAKEIEAHDFLPDAKLIAAAPALADALMAQRCFQCTAADPDDDVCDACHLRRAALRAAGRL